MNIAGSGSLPGGDYNEGIHIAGSGRVNGNVSCTEMCISGSGKVAGNLLCSDKLKVSGSGHIDGSVQAHTVGISGSAHIEGPVTSDGEVHVAGSMHSGAIRCAILKCSGSLHADGDISAEEAVIRGAVHTPGLINAERVDIEIGGDSDADSIGGSTIDIRSRGSRKNFFARLLGGGDECIMTVANSIEGDQITLENVVAQVVTGRIVKIGKNCSIRQVWYSDGVEISPDANVDRYDMINP
ncbi:MAG: polymer-forming cytoskeletal protein [Lachnospiraceae bacterium]|nr:polymer-forming cytoskeletal protein [Lachnospiraceae bacterium]